MRTAAHGILARIPVEAPPLGVCQFADASGGRVGIEHDGVSSRIRITLQDENRRPLEASTPWEAAIGVAHMRIGRVALQIDHPLDLQANE